MGVRVGGRDQLTLGVLEHDPGGGDVVGGADVVVDLGELLRHNGELVLEGAEGALRLPRQTLHDLHVVPEVGHGALLGRQLAAQGGQLGLHPPDSVEGGLVLCGKNRYVTYMFDKGFSAIFCESCQPCTSCQKA
jgi:hypothetical protein